MIPKNQFKVEEDGVFQAWLVAWQQSSSGSQSQWELPVINNLAWFILFIAMLVWNLCNDYCCQKFFVWWPGQRDLCGFTGWMMVIDDEYLLLLKASTISCKEQDNCARSRLLFWKKIVYSGGMAESYFTMRQNGLDINLMSIYVDANFCIGQQNTLEIFYDQKTEKTIIHGPMGLEGFFELHYCQYGWQEVSINLKAPRNIWRMIWVLINEVH